MESKNDTRWIEFIAYMFLGCSAVVIVATYLEPNTVVSGIKAIIALVALGFGCTLLALKQYGDRI